MYDPFDAAMNPPERQQTSRWYGQMFVDVWACVLEKGSGKVPFDATIHDASKRVTAIKVDVVPLNDYNVSFILSRDMIAEFGGWPKVTLPSIRAIGADVRTLHNAYVAVEFAPTGRTYPGKDGTDKEETTFVLVAVFADEAACRDAYEVFNAASEQAEPEPSNGNGKERATAAMFIGPLWAQAGKDVSKLALLLAANPLTSKHFDINSPEVLSVVSNG